jgi:hypothetical protein
VARPPAPRVTALTEHLNCQALLTLLSGVTWREIDGTGRRLARQIASAHGDPHAGCGTALRAPTLSSRSDSDGAEKLSFDNISDPVLPLGERPTLLGDEKLVGGAVDEREERVHGAASVDPGAELTVLD